MDNGEWVIQKHVWYFGGQGLIQVWGVHGISLKPVAVPQWLALPKVAKNLRRLVSSWQSTAFYGLLGPAGTHYILCQMEWDVQRKTKREQGFGDDPQHRHRSWHADCLIEPLCMVAKSHPRVGFCLE